MRNKKKICGFELLEFLSFLFPFLTGRSISGIDEWGKPWTSDLQKKIENHWLNRIEENEFDEGKEREKFYILSMFPYPSGSLHMGHVRVYTISDTFARYQRMKGKNVIHPMGWDAFGLPAENAAIERGLNPKVWTQSNIEHMKSVLEKMNFNFDWGREFATCDADYYKWTQFLFLKLFENGLVYRKEAFVNWDPIDQTVLADEQVNDKGRSWRSGGIVKKRLLTQWFMRTTRYCKSLAEGLRDPILADWSKVVKVQEEWIGKANGTTFDFEVVENDSTLKHAFVTVWMPRPELIHKVKFVAVAPDSVWNSGTVVSGVLPYKVRNPMTGEVVPVYATNFLSFPQGRDNCAGIPEEYECDDLYARSVNLSYDPSDRIIATEEEVKEYVRKICEEAQKMGVGGYPIGSNSRDWLISRQRYWGTPIPIVYCENCGAQGVPEEELPVKLPEVKEIQKGKNAFAEEDWMKTKCPKCGGDAVRETDTMDTFVDSSWYYLRFLDPDNENVPFGIDKAKKYMPVDLYIGGKEHATLHLYYARFMNHFLHSAGLLPHREPFKRLLLQGIVRGKTYRLKSTGNCVRPEDVVFVDNSPVHRETGECLTVTWEKMSKSLFNGVEPTELIDAYGSDSTRLTILTDVAPMNERNWTEDSYRGILKWQSRVWALMSRFRSVRSRGSDSKPEPKELNDLDEKFFDSRNYAVDMVGHSLEENMNVNIAIRKMQSLTNDLARVTDDGIVHSRQFERALATLIILMAPAAPCYASELWSGFVTAENRISESGEIRWDEPVFKQPWPVIDSNYKSKFSNRQGTIKSNHDNERKKRKKMMMMKKKEEEVDQSFATGQKC